MREVEPSNKLQKLKETVIINPSADRTLFYLSINFHEVGVLLNIINYVKFCNCRLKGPRKVSDLWRVNFDLFR
jgi:hypothetical protein